MPSKKLSAYIHSFTSSLVLFPFVNQGVTQDELRVFMKYAKPVHGQLVPQLRQHVSYGRDKGYSE